MKSSLYKILLASCLTSIFSVPKAVDAQERLKLAHGERNLNTSKAGLALSTLNT
jgi:hypothetical protein